jgi:penicillin-binding protein 2
VPLLGRDPARRDRPIRTGRRDRPIIQLPSVALRVAVVIGVGVVMFGIVFFRLWFLQILSGQEFVAQANDNRLKSVKISAPRGNIVDRNGEVIVTNRGGTYVGIRLMDVPQGQLQQELESLAPHLKMKSGKLRAEILDYLRPSTYELKDGKWTSFLSWDKVVSGEITGVDLIPLKEDVSKRIRTYVEEHVPSYPGIEVQDEHLRAYPDGELAAHVLGHVGPISAEQLKTQHFKGYEGGDVVGYDGLEWTYDKWLRGRDGVAKVEVDAQGHPKAGAVVPGGRLAESGDTLVTTIDADVQRAAEKALVEGINLAHGDGQYAANGGAAVVLDVKNGDVLAMASYPTFNPNIWVGGITQKDYNKTFVRKKQNYPQLNRAIQETKAVGSTFKAVTAIAGLEEGIITTSGMTEWCDGSYIAPQDLGKTKFYCWAREGHGTLDLVGAITQSCDVYFYNVGDKFYAAQGTALEDWAKRLGFGALTGIDVPGEYPGRVPTPAWRKEHFKTDWDKQWRPGDSINLAVGQGDLEGTPLQLATAYAAVANGGKVVTPHLGLKIVDPAGQTVRSLEPTAPARKVDISQETLDVVRRGLYQAAHDQAGTSAPVFYNYKIDVSGKTGTAEVWDAGDNRMVDYAWYASYAPSNNPRYAVVVMIEKGGHGASTAAPATRTIYDALFHVDSGEFNGQVIGD